MSSPWTMVVHVYAICFISLHFYGEAKKEKGKYAYLQGNRDEPEDKIYETSDEMYRDALKHILRLFWTEKCHISEVKFQHSKLKISMDRRIVELLDQANELMGDKADEILNRLRDPIASNERTEPISQLTLDHLSYVFKETKRYYEEQIPTVEVEEEIKRIRDEMKLADEQLHEGYGIVKKMISRSASP